MRKRVGWAALLGAAVTICAGGAGAEMRISRGGIPSGSETAAVELSELCTRLREGYDYKDESPFALVRISDQSLSLVREGEIDKVYRISTSKYGIGNEANSNKTPLGIHRVEEKFGKGAPVGTIFRARGNTGKTARIHTDETDVEEDLITTRILWLKGLEKGINQGKGIDSYERMIYIHGTPEEGLIGRPASHGCVRMKNDEVVELFDRLEKGALVVIVE